MSIQRDEDSQHLLLTIPEAAATLRLGVHTVQQLMYRGDLVGIRIGRSRRVSREELLRWIAAQEEAERSRLEAIRERYTPRLAAQLAPAQQRKPRRR